MVLDMGQSLRNKWPVECSFTAMNAIVGHRTYLRMIDKAVEGIVGEHVVGRNQLVAPHLYGISCTLKYHRP